MIARCTETFTAVSDIPVFAAASATADLTARVDRAGAFVVTGPNTPTDLVNFGQLQGLPVVLGLALGAFAVLTVAHLMFSYQEFPESIELNMQGVAAADRMAVDVTTYGKIILESKDEIKELQDALGA